MCLENNDSVGRRHVEFAQSLWFDGELYKFHRWFHMIYILIMQLRGASFILRMKSRVLLRSEVGMIMVSICLHGAISWSQASGCGRFGPTKTISSIPSVLKFCLTWTVCNISNKMTKFYDDVYSFEPVRGCQFLKLYISMFEKWLESPQWLLAVSKHKVRMRVTSAWGQEKDNSMEATQTARWRSPVQNKPSAQAKIHSVCRAASPVIVYAHNSLALALTLSS